MEEENRSFNWSGLLIKIILVVVFILFTIWLLSLSNNRLSDSVDVLTDKIFSENLERMKKVGKEYFTNDKLPSKIGEFEVITLKEMYEKKLITEIKDKNGDACSEENSYISVEKFEDEYQMKVNLECGKDKDYVIVTITCTEAGTCTLTDDSKTEYQYQKVSNGTWGKWSDWSKWSKDIISKLDNRDVETKIEKETKNYIVTDTKIDTKKLECDINSNYIGQNGLDCKYLETETTNLTCPTGYTQVGNVCQKTTSNLVLLDSIIPVCEVKPGYDAVIRNGFECAYKTYTEGNFIETVILIDENAPANDEYYVYKKVSATYKLNVNTSKMYWEYIYGKYESITEIDKQKAVCPKEGYIENGDVCSKYELHTDTVEESLVCPTKEGYALTQNGTTCTYKKEVTKKATCPIGYALTSDGSKCEKEIINTITKTEVIDVTYYRYRTRDYINGTVKYKWSTSKNDKDLLNAGYKLTGKTR